MKAFLLYIFFVSISFSIHAQGVAINSNGSQADSSAILDLSSTSKGVLIPRMTIMERDMIVDPAIGLLIYQTDSIAGFYVYTGTVWSTLLSRENGWGVSGNSGTDPDTHFIGTIDNVPLRFRVNNEWVGEINPATESAFIGKQSGNQATSGTANCGFGAYTLHSNTTGYYNSAFGSTSLYHNTSGYENTAIGQGALFSNDIGIKNTAIGRNALSNNSSGNENTAIGSRALQDNLTGNNNTAIGSEALESNNTGGYNVANGYQALNANINGYFNIAIGSKTMLHNTYGSGNTAVGQEALNNNIGGNSNTAIGDVAMYYNIDGNHNSAIGEFSLYNNINGDYNTSNGDQCLYNNTVGTFNSAVGASALYYNTSGTSNSAVGASALYYNTVGYSNVAVGSNALYYNTTGITNSALGNNSLRSNNSGSSNAAIGAWALNLNTSGSYNSALGYNSGTGGGGWNNTISIGNHGYLNGYHDQAFLGNLSTLWTGGNTVWYTYSDARVKKDIQEDVIGLDFISRLRPVTYYRDIDTQTKITGNTPTEDFEGKYDVEEIKFSGFLAQEVAQAAAASGYDFSGVTTPRHDKELYTLSYEAFVVPLVKAIQEQQAIINGQKEKINSLELRIAAVEILLQQNGN
jgi:hypothetical protein